MASERLYLAFEQLKENLGKEGLFDARWKKPLPLFPNKIGVVTAQTGAAIQDICSTIERRYPLAEIILFPAIVQGPQAAPSIIKSIRTSRYIMVLSMFLSLEAAGVRLKIYGHSMKSQ